DKINSVRERARLYYDSYGFLNTHVNLASFLDYD
ncbi:MAG: hypothetical protein ACJAXB_002596, partial [Candidatus Endobugula sp.]